MNDLFVNNFFTELEKLAKRSEVNSDAKQKGSKAKAVATGALLGTAGGWALSANKRRRFEKKYGMKWADANKRRQAALANFKGK